MAKSVSDSPWGNAAAAPAYERVFHFKRRKMALLLFVIVVAITLLALLWAPRHLFDANYTPRFSDFRGSTRCRKGSCLIGIGLYLFLLLPIWVKASLAGMLVSEAISRSLVYAIFVFDKRPDFAIGRNGVYGLCGLYYYHVSWKEVLSVHRLITTSRYGNFSALIIETTKPGRRRWFGLAQPQLIKFTLLPVHGFDIASIRGMAEVYCPQWVRPDVYRSLG